jgi:ferric-dicitrate binding protein FerR (iron transport regulator)
MDHSFLRELLKKYREGKASPDEIKLLHTYYDAFELTEADQTSSDSAINERKGRIKYAIDQAIVHQEQVLPVRKFRLRTWLIAAALVLAAGSGIFWWMENRPADTQVAEVSSRSSRPDIAPGTNRAVLVLADGSSVLLDDAEQGELSRQANAIINKTADGQIVYENQAGAELVPLVYNTISTPRAGQYRLTLTDGTKVWLNAATSLQFPASFPGKERRVKLTGEAYFEVASNASQPFIVETSQQSIEVLGTHFNVNAYEEERQTKTTLLEGKVKVQTGSSVRVIKPGEQAASMQPGSLRVSEADTEEAIAWKNGYFKFNKADIQTIMRQLERWYDVDVEYQGAVPTDLFVGKINRSENISGVLRILELSKVQFKIVNRKIIVGNK